VNSKPRRVLEGDFSEGLTKYHAKFAAPHSAYEGELGELELEWQPLVSLAAQTKRERRIAWLRLEDSLNSSGNYCIINVVVYD
jgi:hypothetical protein